MCGRFFFWISRINKILTMILIIGTIVSLSVTVPLAIKYFKESTAPEQLYSEFNGSYIYAQKYEAFAYKNGTDFSHVDTITLNFTVYNENPEKKYRLGNLLLFITESKDEVEKFIETKNSIKNDECFVYQGQYIYDKFEWGYVNDYKNLGGFQMTTIPPYSDKSFIVEFYPVNWTEEGLGKDKLNFEAGRKYFYCLFEGWQENSNDETIWYANKIMKSKGTLKLKIYENVVQHNMITEEEKAEMLKQFHDNPAIIPNITKCNKY